jgi:hypothetical protein
MAKRGVEGRSDVVDALEGLSGRDLRALCELFVLPTSGSNRSKISRILGLGRASDERIVQFARLVRFGYCAEDCVTSRHMEEIQHSAGLRVSGSKHDIFMEILLNDISPASAMMARMDARGVRSTYKCIFDKAPIDNVSALISEIKSWLDYRGPGKEPEQPVVRAGSNSYGTSGLSPETPSAPTGIEEPAKDVIPTRYDVAISYAGEDVTIARELAEELGKVGSVTFFAPYHKARLWGKSLNEELKTTYGKKATYVLVLVSKHYAVKDFTNFEFTIARDEARMRKEEFILPVRLDDTPLIGLHPDVFYLDYRQMGAAQIAQLIKDKMRLSKFH